MKLSGGDALGKGAFYLQSRWLRADILLTPRLFPQ
jgi:hypothetical protein